MRLYAAWAAFIFMCGYAFYNWYRAALFLVVAMAVVERPDFPKQVAGIPGLNPWNLLLACTILGYLFSRTAKRPPLGGGMLFLVIFYVLAIVVAFLRAYIDMDGIIDFASALGAEPISKTGLIIDDLINTLKYIAPGVLIYLGCNSHERVKEAMWALVLMNCMLALLVVRSMGFDALGSGTELEQTAIRRLDRDTGYFRSDLAILLAGSSWAVFAYSRFVENPLVRLALIGGSMVCALAIGMSGGRMGMAAWGVLGLAFGILRWRRILVLGPLAAIVIVAFIPAVQERMFQGFNDQADERHTTPEVPATDGDVNLNSVTSGRVIIWPHVIEKIKDSPFFGHGRRAMQRTGLSLDMKEQYDKPFAHPHNAYLQLFLDNGFLIGIPILLFHLLVLKYSIQMIRDVSQPVYAMVGSVSFAFSLSFLVGSIAQQSFYPFIGSVSMWVSFGLLLRVRAERLSILKNNSSAAVAKYQQKNAFAPATAGYESWLGKAV